MDSPFVFHSPVKTFVNTDFDETLLSLVKESKNIAVVSGRTSVEKTGFKTRVEALCSNKNLMFFSEIEENPSINTIIKGGRKLQQFKADTVIAFGGGSAVDAAKAIALAAQNRGGFYDLLNGQNLKPALPVIAIPTTCGTGSEMNNYAIITDLERADKVNLSKDSMFPVAAILEPDFLKTLDKDTLIATVFDAFTHAFEGFLSKRANPFSDTVALASIDLILTTMKESEHFENLTDDILRKFLYVSSLAGIVILHTGTTLLHALGYYFTNHKKVHHGKANAILLNAYVQMYREGGQPKIQAVEDLFEQHGMILGQFTKPYYGGMTVADIVPESEAKPFIDYALGKKNAEFTDFPVEFDRVKSVLYPQ